jgi:hypothetical protein
MEARLALEHRLVRGLAYSLAEKALFQTRILAILRAAQI